MLTLKTSRGLAMNDYFFTEYRNCRLEESHVRVAIDGFRVSLVSDRPAFFVWADAVGCHGEFDDNSFTLLPGISKTIRFRPKEGTVTPERFRTAFRLTHLAQQQTKENNEKGIK